MKGSLVTTTSNRPQLQQQRAAVKQQLPAPRTAEALAVLVQHLVFNVSKLQSWRSQYIVRICSKIVEFVCFPIETWYYLCPLVVHNTLEDPSGEKLITLCAVFLFRYPPRYLCIPDTSAGTRHLPRVQECQPLSVITVDANAWVWRITTFSIVVGLLGLHIVSRAFYGN